MKMPNEKEIWRMWLERRFGTKRPIETISIKKTVIILLFLFSSFFGVLLVSPQKNPKPKVDSTDLMRKQKKVSNTMDKQLILWDSLLIEKKKRDTLK